MNLSFTKMHGLGNDFVVFNAMGQPFTLNSAQIRCLADRHLGVGCDQILVVGNSQKANHDFSYRIFNADGGEVEHCGNGARCFLRYVRSKNLTSKRSVLVEIMRGSITLSETENGDVTVNMGVPSLLATDLPFAAEKGDDKQKPRARAQNGCELWNLPLSDNSHAEIGLVSMGNPHAVQVVADISTAPVATRGALIQTHPAFPQQVNVGFMQIVNNHTIKLRVFERGSGETLACGTGACAAVASGIARGLLTSPVQVQTRGGNLNIAWPGEGKTLLMTGPAVTVFEGSINTDTLLTNHDDL